MCWSAILPNLHERSDLYRWILHLLVERYQFGLCHHCQGCKDPSRSLLETIRQFRVRFGYDVDVDRCQCGSGNRFVCRSSHCINLFTRVSCLASDFINIDRDFSILYIIFSQILFPLSAVQLDRLIVGLSYPYDVV